jgi:CheY-like chemotaxis protein
MKPIRHSLLIAESDDILAVLLEEHFSELGFTVETARGGVECLTKIRRSPPDVLLLDMDLRWGEGDGVLARLSDGSVVPAVPVIVMTAVDAPCPPPVPANHIIQLIQKPFLPDTLLATIRSVSGKGEESSPSMGPKTPDAQPRGKHTLTDKRSRTSPLQGDRASLFPSSGCLSGGDTMFGRDECDERLAAVVKTSLHEAGNSGFDRLSVSALDGIVILRGKVANCTLKKVAQTWTLTVPGVQGLCNELEVDAC